MILGRDQLKSGTVSHVMLRAAYIDRNRISCHSRHPERLVCVESSPECDMGIGPLCVLTVYFHDLIVCTALCQDLFRIGKLCFKDL